MENAFFPRRYFDDLMIEEQKITREIKGTIPKLDREFLSKSVMPPMLNQESSNFLPGLPSKAKMALFENDMSHSNTISNPRLIMDQTLSPGNKGRIFHD